MATDLNRRLFQTGALSLLGLSACATAQNAPRRLNLAVAQMHSDDGAIDANLRRASQLAEAARADGAELILFPEFMPTGNALNASIFRAAEPRDGPTARWLSATSRRLRTMMGTSFLEAAEGAHFNTFVLTGADGRELGRVRKETPASLEVIFFRGDAGPHVIDTPIGRIGVGICYESYLCSTERYFAAGRPDLILLPHSFPDMRNTGGTASPPGTFTARWYARRFGVPVAMCNKVGPWNTMTPLGHAIGTFPGASAIVDSNNDVRVSMNDQAGCAVATVTLDPAHKSTSASACEGELIPYLTQFDWTPNRASAGTAPAPQSPAP